MKQQFKICSIFDTETCNFGVGANTRAYPILYIFNDLRNKSISEYTTDDDDVRFFRYTYEAINYLRDLIQFGIDNEIIPIVCAYNLAFDLQPLIKNLCDCYEIKVNAQTSSNIYTFDLISDEKIVLRFWDTFHLENNGLVAMGTICGLAKAQGDWNYSLIRTPKTKLTQLELFYATRDVQVIPAYLRYILEANEHLRENDLGVSCLTKTSIVRLFAKRKIGSKSFKASTGKRYTYLQVFEHLCKDELPKDFATYALRVACFRGGFTFTAGNEAFQLKRNVASLDVTSMHHAFINSRKIPRRFQKIRPQYLEKIFANILSTPRDYVFNNYNEPFNYAFHAACEFTNLRLRKNSAFEKFGIALIPQGRFVRKVAHEINERTEESVNAIRTAGYQDVAWNGIFAFGKLYSASKVLIHINELELYAMHRVYEWDDLRSLYGEASVSFITPPDYVTLQSNILFNTKNDAKQINKRYREGVSYKEEIPETIPEEIAKKLHEGSLTNTFFEAYYQNTVKGMFNGIYGTMAQNLFKPSFSVEDGEFSTNPETIVFDNESFQNVKDTIERPRVLYTYGMRIVGGSRLHLVFAIELLYENFGLDATILGGDTDSLKVACSVNLTDEQILDALKPLHVAIKSAIDSTMTRVRATRPMFASDLDHVGEFEIETHNGRNRYEQHVEFWNKARISFDAGKFYITCAGLSRPKNAYNIIDFANELYNRGFSFEQIAKNILGFNICIDCKISHSLEHHRPKARELFDEIVVDYQNCESHVQTPQSIALYPADRILGDTSKKGNLETLQYLQKHGIDVDFRFRTCEILNGVAHVTSGDEIIL